MRGEAKPTLRVIPAGENVEAERRARRNRPFELSQLVLALAPCVCQSVRCSVVTYILVTSCLPDERGANMIVEP